MYCTKFGQKIIPENTFSELGSIGNPLDRWLTGVHNTLTQGMSLTK